MIRILEPYTQASPLKSQNHNTFTGIILTNGIGWRKIWKWLAVKELKCNALLQPTTERVKIHKQYDEPFKSHNTVALLLMC